MSKTLIWEEPPSTGPLVVPWRKAASTEPVRAKPIATDSAWEKAALAILVRPIVGESAAAGHARKEAELKQVFAALSVPESRALHARLAMPNEDDELARLIGRMVHDRRQRLIAFVADARRREAATRCA